MTFLSPIAALVAAGVVTPLLVLLYFLKLRRRDAAVSSTLLWRKAVEDLQANAPFQRLRRNLLLLLQLLILAALLVAMARPTIRQTELAGKRVVILIDHSASMNATDVSPSRLDEAKRLAKELAASSSGGGSGSGAGGVMVVSFAAGARIVEPFTGDAWRVADAIDAIRPTDESSRLASALQLIEPFAAQDGGALAVYILSDGRASDAKELSLRGAAVRFLRVGSEKPDNVGIAALSARRDYRRPERVQGYAGLVNCGATAVRVNLTLRLEGQVAKVIPVDLPPAPAAAAPPETTPVSFEFDAPGSVLIEASLDRQDDLAADNRAWVLVAPPRRARVLLVSAGNPFLERAIRASGVRSLTVLEPSRYAAADPAALARGGWSGPGSEGFDVAVFDRYSPTTPPAINGLYFACVPRTAGLELLPPATGAPELQAVLDWKRDAPALRYVALDEVTLARPGRLALPESAQVLATAVSGPVLAQVNTGQGVRAIVASFDLYRSNWPLEVGFPVFIANAVESLALGEQTEAGMQFRPGDTILATARRGAAAVEFAGPATLAAPVVDGQAALPAPERIGVYRGKAGVDPPWDRLAVSLLDANESDLRPVAALTVGAERVPAQGGRQAPVRREVYTWFLWPALAVLLVEWVVYVRKMHL